MRHSHWTLRTFENGETNQVRTGLSHNEAVDAIERAMRGLDPVEAVSRPVHTVESGTDEHRIPVAA